MEITYSNIIEVLRAASEPLDYVNAMWLGGAAAFGREDELSDVDACFDVADGRQDELFEVIEAALESKIAPIEHRMVMPDPAWHGHSQRIYRLKGAPEYLMIDVVIMQRSTDAPRFSELEIHGEPQVIFDKLDIIKAEPLDKEAHREMIRKRFETMKAQWYMLKHLGAKELPRGNVADAFHRYYGFVLNPLLEVLRMKHAPVFAGFGQRYLKLHLPADVYGRYKRLAFVKDAEDLSAKIAEAEEWGDELYSNFDPDEVEL